jgi:TolA-binding protein
MARERSGRQLALAERIRTTPVYSNSPASTRAGAALTLVGQADRLRDLLQRRDDALATYRRAAALFPETPSAAVARQRIEQLESPPKT